MQWEGDMQRRMNIELHSLSRYPPLGLDEEACAELCRQGLVACTVRPGPHQSGRYRLTATGRERRNATTDGCSVDHCPCKGGTESGEVQDIVDRELRKRGLIR
jgi:hypothetical protein